MALYENYLVLAHQSEEASSDSEGNAIPATYGDVTVYKLNNLDEP